MREIGHSGSTVPEQIPEWAWEVLASPGGGPLRREGRILRGTDHPIGRIDQGILRFDTPGGDPSTEYYRSVGGAHFHERSTIPYAMTALDTPVYHAYLREFAPDDHDIMVIDVGGGDGRNALPWLQWGFKRVLVADSTAAALRKRRIKEKDKTKEKK
jgi:hypothetical protein